MPGLLIPREVFERELIEFATAYQGYGAGLTPQRPFADFGVDLDMVMSEGARFGREHLERAGYVDEQVIRDALAVCFTVGCGAGLRLGREAVRRGITA